MGRRACASSAARPTTGPVRFLVPWADREDPEGGAEKGVWVPRGAQSPLGVGGGRAGAIAPCWQAPSDWAPHLCQRAVERHPLAVLPLVPVPRGVC